MRFYKMHGAGNDFIFIDNRKQSVELDAERIRLLCHRRFGVGADGIMLLSEHPAVDFQIEFYNADGTKGAMCGNGVRCAVYLAHHLGMCRGKTRFAIWGKDYEAEIVDGQTVKLQMHPPKILPKFRDLHHLDDTRFKNMYWIDTGVPHLVIELNAALDKLDVKKWGAHFRNHPFFAPEGVNVNFVQQKADHQLKVRTYERGVEDETLACGTGAVACAFFARDKWGWASPIVIEALGGTLKVELGDPLTLIGPASLVYEGIIADSFWQQHIGQNAAATSNI
jgi:diaminopimelate epimerase